MLTDMNEFSSTACNTISQTGVKESTNHVLLNQIVMHSGEVLIPLIIFAAIFGIVFVIVSARNRERMAMIEKGVNPKDFLSASLKPNPYGILKWALLLVGLGFGLFIGSVLEAYTTIKEEPAYFASALFFGGLGLVVAFMILKKADQQG